MDRLSRTEIEQSLTDLTLGRGLSPERLVDSALLTAPWIAVETRRTGESPERLCFLFLRHIISEYERGFGPRSHAVRAGFNLHPDASSPKLGRRRDEAGQLMGLSARTMARYISAAITALAIAFQEAPTSELIDRLRTDQPEPGKVHLHVRTFSTTLYFDDLVRQTKTRLEYRFVSRVKNLRRTRLTSGYERVDARETIGVPISYIEGAELLEEFNIPNGNMVHRLEFPHEFNPGEEQFVIIERDLTSAGQLKKQFVLSSGTPVESVSIRLSFRPPHVPTRVWSFEGIEHFSAPTAFSEDCRVPVDRLGIAELKTNLSYPAYVCGLAWD